MSDTGTPIIATEMTLPYRQQVEAMAGYGIPEKDIAKVLDIPPEVLSEQARRELEGGEIKANAKVAENLYRRATGEGREAVTAAIFWLKTRAGWRETSVHEIAGKEPITIVFPPMTRGFCECQ